MTFNTGRSSNRLETSIWVFSLFMNPLLSSAFPSPFCFAVEVEEWVRGCFLVLLPKQVPPTCCSYKSTATGQFNRASREAAYSWARLPVQRTQSTCSYGPLFLGRPRVLVIIANRSAKGVGKGMQLMRE